MNKPTKTFTVSTVALAIIAALTTAVRADLNQDLNIVHITVLAATSVISTVDNEVRTGGLMRLEALKTGSVAIQNTKSGYRAALAKPAASTTSTTELITGRYAAALYLASRQLGTESMPRLDSFDRVAIGNSAAGQLNRVMVAFYRETTPPPLAKPGGNITLGCGNEVPFIVDLKTNKAVPVKKVC